MGPCTDGPAHGSSGQDATLTAEVFLMEMGLWIRTEMVAVVAKRQRKVRLSELESELDSLNWQEVHKRASVLGINICKSGTSERRPLAEIKVEIQAIECPSEPQMITASAG